MSRRAGAASTALRFALLLTAVLGATTIAHRISRPDTNDRASPGLPARIASAVPSGTEILFRLGAENRVVGVSRYCTWPPETRSIPTIGGYLDLDLEALLALSPDLVVLQGGAREHDDLTDRLASLGIESFGLRLETLDDLIEEIQRLGDTIGSSEAARRLAQRLGTQIDRADSFEGTRPRVLFLVGRQPGELRGIVAAGPGTFIDEILQRAGAQNALTMAATPYPNLSIEDLIALSPDVIVEARPGENFGPSEITSLRETWAPLSSIPAVARERIHILTDPGVLILGPRVENTLERITEIVQGKGGND